MGYPNNYIRYPRRALEPVNLKISGRSYTVHGFHFRGLQEFYSFLKSNPGINYEVWPKTKIESVNNDFDFAGIPYDQAIEKLVNKNDPGYQEYLKVQKKLPAKKGNIHEYQQHKSVSGGVIDPVAYTTGSAKIYRTTRKIAQPKFITLDTQVAYYCGTEKSQVFNRALIITNLIRALERKGYSVDINSFMVAQHDDEVIKAIFEIKRHGGSMNYQALYKTLVDVEFFRRLCFRLIEVSDVKTDWCYGYGRTSEESFVRELLGLKKDDIYFDQPRDMNIDGYDIGEDFESTIKKLKLEDKIDVEKEKEVLRQSVKVLQR